MAIIILNLPVQRTPLDHIHPQSPSSHFRAHGPNVVDHSIRCTENLHLRFVYRRNKNDEIHILQGCQTVLGEILKEYLGVSRSFLAIFLRSITGLSA